MYETTRHSMCEITHSLFWRRMFRSLFMHSLERKYLIHWIQMTPTEKPAHSFYYNTDQLQRQHEGFRGRTSLSKEQISRGNASLLLSGVRVEDEGRYKCYSSVLAGNHESFINLKAYGTRNPQVQKTKTENQIICSSDGIYPEPDLSWSISPPSSRTFQNTTRVQKTEELLYNIRSSLTLSDREDDLDYICTISTPSNQRRASWRRGRETLVSMSQVRFPTMQVDGMMEDLAGVSEGLYFRETASGFTLRLPGR
uniref:Ig-like domain-containing protein n=1 Tax=Oryzias latipes TaxID=8090 RepID=A0A3B3I4Y8_ORYLA